MRSSCLKRAWAGFHGAQSARWSTSLNFSFSSTEIQTLSLKIFICGLMASALHFSQLVHFYSHNPHFFSPTNQLWCQTDTVLFLMQQLTVWWHFCSWALPTVVAVIKRTTCSMFVVMLTINSNVDNFTDKAKQSKRDTMQNQQANWLISVK